MHVPDDLRYSPDHEWARAEGGRVRVGITDYAQENAEEIVFAQLPDVGTEVTARDLVAEIDSQKASSEIYAPVSGTVVEVNEALEDEPTKINEDPYGEGWLFVLESDASLDHLLTPDAYRALIDEG